MTAKENYETNANKIKFELALLNDKLKQHSKAFIKRDSDWSAVGDLGHVLEELRNLNVFLKR